MPRKQVKSAKLVRPIPFVLKSNYISVVVGGKSFALDSTHPTFDAMAKALRAKDWKKVPKLISIAETISSESRGNIVVKGGEVFYKGRPVHSALTKRIVEMVKGRKPIKHMLMFMENLYKNPFGEVAINELFDFLDKYSLPITDDGHFVAYKSIDGKYKDAYTHTIDNSVGQVIMMPSSKADLNQRTACSYGFHVCARTYLSGFHNYGGGGGHLMKVKVNPKHVIAVPYNEAKVRCVQYEVIGEITGKDIQKVIDITDVSEYMTPVYPIQANRKEYLEKILAHPTVKRNLKKGKIALASIKKAAVGRLEHMYKKLGLTEVRTELSEGAKTLDAPLKSAREAAGFTIKEVADKLGKTYKQVAALERDPDNTQATVDKYLTALAELSGIRDIRTSGIAYPKPVKQESTQRRNDYSYASY